MCSTPMGVWPSGTAKDAAPRSPWSGNAHRICVSLKPKWQRIAICYVLVAFITVVVVVAVFANIVVLAVVTIAVVFVFVASSLLILLQFSSSLSSTYLLPPSSFFRQIEQFIFVIA